MKKKFKPEFFGKYLLLEKLAAGGMAEVFLARAPGASGIGKIVAMKRILPQFSDNQEFIDMFKTEAKIAINLSHGNVVSIYEFGIEANQLYLTMEYVEGKNLRQILNALKKQNKSLSIDQVVYIVKQIASGLDHAHKCIDGSTGKPLNIIHRDMSPQNVMTSFDGEIKVVDFGIAKAESQVEKTKAGTLKGKFGYMSPEQAQGLEVDIRTDIFSLGIVLWELLAGERLFIANNEINTLRKIRDCNIPSIRKINPKVPEELEVIVNKSLTKDRNLRYQTCEELFKDLNRFLNMNYPDFSEHNIAEFTSAIYADQIVEVRNRIVEYSKIPFKNTNQTEKEKSNFLELMTNSSPLVIDDPDAGNMKNSKRLSLESDSPDIDFSNSRLKTDNPFQTSSYKRKSSTSTSASIRKSKADRGSVRNVSVVNRSTNTRNTSRHVTPRTQKKSSFVPVLLFLLLMGGGYYLFNDIMNSEIFYELTGHKEEIEAFSDGEESFASEQEEDDDDEDGLIQVQEKIKVVINSSPSGARIILNGNDLKRITPSQIEVPFNAEFDLMLTKKNYIDRLRKNFTIKSRSTRSLNHTLEVANTAYISIDIRPLKEANIYINNKPLAENDFPIKNYVVPSQKDLIIKAVNPYKNIIKYKTLKLTNGQRKSIHFDLTTSRKATNNR